MKTIDIESDLGLVVGKGHVVILDWGANSDLFNAHGVLEIQAGDIIRIKGKSGRFVVRDIEYAPDPTQSKKPHTGSLVIKPVAASAQADIKTLADAITFVNVGRDAGVTCPCCGQYCKVYHRALNAPMVRFLIWLVKEFESRGDAKTWVNVNDGPLIQHRKGGGDFAKMVHWGLIEQMANIDDTKRSSGYWRPTQSGIDFVYNKIDVPKKVLLYLNEPVGYSAAHITVREALGTKFNYRELMEEF